jgi:hypothetical protein
MAKLTVAEGKVQLQNLELSINAVKAAGIEPHKALTDAYERLLKFVTGNASENVSSLLNEKLAPQLNKNQQFLELIANAVGSGVKVGIKVAKAEDGTLSISFEAAGGGSGGAKSGVSTGGGTKTPSAYNHYEVSLKAENADYKEQSGSFASAQKALDFILNGGKNPIGKGAEFGKGNSAKRVLVGDSGNGGLLADELFNQHFELKASYVEPAKKTTEAAAPAEGTSEAKAE